MTGKELRKMINNGLTIVVEFTERVEDAESRFDVGMRAYVVGVTEPDKSDLVKVKFDEREFKDSNLSLEKAVWHNPITNEFDAKWSELEGNNNHDGKVTLYEMESDPITNFVILEDKNYQLFQRYLNEGVGVSYVKWLESLILT